MPFLVTIQPWSSAMYIQIKYAVCIVLSSQKMDLESPGFELGTFRFQTQRFTTEPTRHYYYVKKQEWNVMPHATH